MHIHLLPVFLAALLAVAMSVCGMSAAPSNTNDSFLAGSYGGINRIGMEGDIYALYINHGFDWVWLQHKLAVPQILAGQGTEKLIRDVASRCRILLRVLWWGDHKTFSPWQHELNTFGIKPAQYGGEDLTGKDWIDLADDPTLLRKAMRTIDWQIDVIESRCGKGTLYAVTLSEEEPDVGMYFGRGMGWFGQHETEAWPKIERVHNALYDHVKQRYPHLKIATTFYPGRLKRATVAVNLKHDLVCIDPYPEKGQLNEAVSDCRQVYGVSDKVYILLWGCGSVRAADGYCLKSYQEDTEWAETVFRTFRMAGYRNIGWFGLNYRANSFDRICHWIDADSPGTCAPSGLSDAVTCANREWRETVRITRACPEELRQRLKLPAQPAVIETKGKSEAALRNALRESAEKRYALISSYLDAAEETARIIRSLAHVATTEKFLSAYGLIEACAPVVSESEQRHALAQCSAFERLPNFFRVSDDILTRVKSRTHSILNETEKTINRVQAEHPDASVKQALDALTGLRDAWQRRDFPAGADKAKELAHAMAAAGLSSGVTLRAFLVNPYSYEVNAAPVIRMSDDGEKWTEIYRGEPFHGETRPVIELPFSAAPRFIMVDNGAWTGTFGVDAVGIQRGDDFVCMKVERSAGDVIAPKLAEEHDGKYARINHMGGGYEKDYIVFSAGSNGGN